MKCIILVCLFFFLKSPREHLYKMYNWEILRNWRSWVNNTFARIYIEFLNDFESMQLEKIMWCYKEKKSYYVAKISFQPWQYFDLFSESAMSLGNPPLLCGKASKDIKAEMEAGHPSNNHHKLLRMCSKFFSVCKHCNDSISMWQVLWYHTYSWGRQCSWNAKNFAGSLGMLFRG